MNLALISVAVAFAMGFGSALQINSWRNDHADKQRLEIAAESQRFVHAAEQARSSRVITAQDNSRKRAVTRAVELGAAQSAGNWLRIAVDTAVRTAQTNPDAYPDQAVTLAVVFGECKSALLEMGKDADEWFSEYQLMLDAQPKE